MARDASSQGDRVSAENFYQHAEHYFRVINNQNQSNGRQPLRAMPTPADDQDQDQDQDMLSGENEAEEREAVSEEEESEGGEEGQVETASA